MALRRLRALARVELRSVIRNKARSALVVTLIAIPVAALVAGSIVVKGIELSPIEQVARQLGDADILVAPHPSAINGVLAALPAGCRVDRVVSSPERLVTGGAGCAVTRCAFDTSGAGAKLLRVIEGRMPASPDEAALSPRLLRAVGLRLGDAVGLASRSTPIAVVGVVVDPDDLSRALVAVTLDAEGEAPARSSHLITLPQDVDGRRVAAALRAGGLRVRTRREILASPSSIAPAIFLLGTLGFVEAALVAAAAFAVGVRRRQREVGLLAASGAAAPDIVASHVVVATGLALVAGGVGASVGIGAAALLYPQIDGWVGRVHGRFEVPLPQLFGAVALAVGTTVLAAWWPARVAARMPIRLALSGRRPLRPSTRSWLAAAVALILLGLGLVLVAPHCAGTASVLASVVGAVSGVLGFGACSPWLLDACSRGATRLPLAWRLAVRDTARDRSRSVPVVTAILAGTAVGVTAASILASIAAVEVETVGPRWVSCGVLLLSLVIGLSVIAAATALAAAESRADRMTLVAVGATPALIRAHAGARAASQALLGCALAVPAGLLPALGATAAVGDLRFTVPWVEIGAMALGLPLLAYLGAACFTRSPGSTRRA